MARYNVNTAWDDPYEPRANRRDAPRFDLKIKISITVEHKGSKHRLVGPGVVRNLSVTGAYLITKHNLAPGQKIVVAIPTVDKPFDLFLPEAFVGPAYVIRVEPDQEDRVRVALRFGDELIQNLEFAMFMRHLQALHGVARDSQYMTPPPRVRQTEGTIG